MAGGPAQALFTIRWFIDISHTGSEECVLGISTVFNACDRA